MAASGFVDVPEDERDVVIEDLLPTTISNVEYSLIVVVGKIISHKVLNKNVVQNIMCKT